MRNILVIARNEYANLTNSRLVLLTGIIYLFFVVHKLINLRPPGDPGYEPTLFMVNLLHSNGSADYYTYVLLITLSHILTFFGGFFVLVLGVFSVGLERYGNTLNCLIVKPLYRDTIINGKLLGSSLFILTIFVLTAIAYTMFAMVFWGSAFLPLAGGYLIRLPIVTVFALVEVMVYFTLSLLISLLVTDLAFALILSIGAGVLLTYLPGTLVRGNLSILLGLDDNVLQFHQWVPENILYDIYKTPVSTDTILCPSMNLLTALSEALPEMARLVVYLIILALAGYFVFTRSDVS